ncbi:GNAT family N-acetyltransferase [Neobacillus sp. PS3-40]|uniref:GNAT family N-acetyltransferase n=1 Tax=Neobacillus sp. PS3-40 TaxID=3070679 RepID=UPI0027DEFAD6|nr:GNAT family N-acetyltransferase [Neobacillus sp. PS3-40]WML45819.1 GNAT family N-acetyltransferase [Neobacillus sp. PS3-40]
MYRFEVINNPGIWKSILLNIKNVDCYYTFEYGNLFAKNENGKLYASYFEENGTKIFYPFIKRKVPFVEDETYDIVTPYGYGGPLINGESKYLEHFYQVFSEYCRLNNIITETIRFHPLYRNYEWCEKVMDVEYIRQTTAVDLTLALAEIRNKYTSMNKRNIKKALKNNLTCFVAENNKENIKIFMDLYKETMDRNNATDFYYFDEIYFLEQVKDTAFSNTFLLFTKVNNEIIAGVMVIWGQDFAHYHLGASKTKYLDLKPNNVLFDFMIEFCKSKGLKNLHLGGGYQENDGLFKFKTSFTNNNNFKYFIGKRIYDSKKYNKIIEFLRNYYEINESYFPIYRSQIQKKKLFFNSKGV